MRIPSRIAALLLSLTFVTCVSAEELVSLQTRDGVEQKFILTKPDGEPTAAVILFAGGHGKLSLSAFLGSPSIGWGSSNNLVRTRKDYANQGLLVATVDAPSNLKKMNAIFRMSAEHAEDISAVVDYLKQVADVPVWAVGTSMGSFSAANMGISLGGRIHGVVLTSSITRSPRKWSIYEVYPNAVMDMDLNTVAGPVLVVSHESDGCDKTPASDLPELAKRFTGSSKVEQALFTGGYEEGDPCEAMSYHGYLGIEQQIVDRVAAFIKAN